MRILPSILGASLAMVPACAQEKSDLSMRTPGAAAAELHPQSPSLSITPYNSTPRPPRVPSQFNSVRTSRRIIALTFDDGPHPELTPKLLDILRQQGIRATFFVVGRNVEAHPEIARRIVAEGHEIANHSWSHPDLTKLGEQALRREVEDTSAAIERATGRRVTKMRPPYGAINQRIREVLTKDHNLDVVLWSVDPLDWRKPGPSVVTQRLVDGATPGGILLAHDIQAGTIEAMPETIAQLKAKGYGFATVSQLLAMREEARPPVVADAPAAAQSGNAADQEAPAAAR
jgi:peptidoglycan/xylan/chitin deacetylase (PgdA/CDA1 family)